MIDYFLSSASLRRLGSVERLPIELAISRVALHLFRIDLIDIERRIGLKNYRELIANERAEAVPHSLGN